MATRTPGSIGCAGGVASGCFVASDEAVHITRGMLVGHEVGNSMRNSGGTRISHHLPKNMSAGMLLSA